MRASEVALNIGEPSVGREAMAREARSSGSGAAGREEQSSVVVPRLMGPFHSACNATPSTVGKTEGQKDRQMMA